VKLTTVKTRTRTEGGGRERRPDPASLAVPKHPFFLDRFHGDVPPDNLDETTDRYDFLVPPEVQASYLEHRMRSSREVFDCLWVEIEHASARLRRGEFKMVGFHACNAASAFANLAEGTQRELRGAEFHDAPSPLGFSSGAAWIAWVTFTLCEGRFRDRLEIGGLDGAV
jgi:hypothetical protein